MFGVVEKPPCVTPPSGLVSWWQAEGNATDVAAGNNGTLLGGVAFAPGKAGQGFSFNASSNYIRVPASASLDLGQGPGLSIETWIKPEDVSSSHPIVEWNKNSGTIPWGVHFWVMGPPYAGPGSLCANLVDKAGNNHGICAGGALATSGFQHVALTYDKASGLARLYLNGTVVQDANLGTFTPETSYDLYIGYRPMGIASTSFLGVLDEVSLYGRALDSAEIQAIYNAGSAGKCKEPLYSCVRYTATTLKILSVRSGQPPTESKRRVARALRLGSSAATLTATTWDLLMIPSR